MRKGAFEEYRRVIDVLIPRKSSQDRDREANFAFIRYREKYEMEMSLKWGNHQWLDGRRIIVRRVELVKEEVKSERVNTVMETKANSGIAKQRLKGRSFKEVVFGEKMRHKDGREIDYNGNVKNVKRTTSKIRITWRNEKKYQDGKGETVFVKATNLDKEMLWVMSSAMGKLKAKVSCMAIKVYWLVKGSRLKLLFLIELIW